MSKKTLVLVQSMQEQIDRLTRELAEAKARALDWITHPETIEAKRQWDAVATALGADKDCPDSVLRAAKARAVIPDGRRRGLLHRPRVRSRRPGAQAVSAESGKVGYTLPCLPGPAVAKKYGPQVEAYGHACAEAARAPLVARIAELEAERDRVQTGLLDPDTVHVNMLRGTIAWIGWRRACHITGNVPNGEDYQLSEIVRLRADLAAKDGEVEKLRADAERWKWRKENPTARLVYAGGSWRVENWTAWHPSADAAVDAAIAARKGEGSEG